MTRFGRDGCPLSTDGVEKLARAVSGGDSRGPRPLGDLAIAAPGAFHKLGSDGTLRCVMRERSFSTLSAGRGLAAAEILPDRPVLKPRASSPNSWTQWRAENGSPNVGTPPKASKRMC